MMKYLIGLFFCCCVDVAFAQNGTVTHHDTTAYYVSKAGRVVSTKDSADILLLILPPDTNVDKKLFLVKAFYKTGKVDFLTGSTTHDLPLNLQGAYVAYYPNGRKKLVKSYENGQQTGSVLTFYPNGRFYNKQTLLMPPKGNIKLSYDDCNDSLGNTLAENGNGNWITYNDDFTKINESGKIAYGLRDSVWLNNEYNNPFKQTYLDGILVDGPDAGKIFTSVEIMPEFPGGRAEFGKFLAKNVRYPAVARENNTQGRVIVTFVCEQDGSLSDIKISRGIGDECDEETIRVMKLCPKWNPGMQNGNPVRVACSVPVSFTLSNNGTQGMITTN